MSRKSESIMVTINSTVAAVQVGSCDRQTGKDVLNNLIRMFTDELVDGRYFGYRVSGGVATALSTRFDHIVPVDVIVEFLLATRLEPPLAREIELRETIRIAQITEVEHNYLATIHLKQMMPAYWKWGDDPYERYNVAGILLLPGEREIDARIGAFISSTI